MAYRRREESLSDVLTDKQVEELLYLRRNGDTLQALADQFGVHMNTVRNIIRRDRARRRKAAQR